MKFFLLIIATLVAGCAAATSIPQIIVSYDRFKDEANVSTSPHIFVHSEHHDLITLSTYASYSCEGNGSCKPNNISIRFISESYYGWRYLSSYDLILIVDGERMNFGETIRVGDVASNVAGVVTIEVMLVIVPVDKFVKIANAQIVEGKLGMTTFDITYKERELFRMLLARAQ